MTATNSPAPLMTRLLRRMERDGASGCWIWQGAQSFDGYGQIRIGDRIVGAHRAMVIAREGSIAPGMEVDHAENLRRKYAAITHCKHGHPYDEANTINRPNGSITNLRAIEVRTCGQNCPITSSPARSWLDAQSRMIIINRNLT